MSGERCFVVFSDDWGRHPSSCQHLFKRIARDHRVLWVNTIGLRAPQANAFTFWRGVEKLREWLHPLRQISENLWVLAPIMLPVAGEGAMSRLNRWLTVKSVRRTMRRLDFREPVLWSSLPTAGACAGRLGESLVVYYVTDDYSLWPGGNAETIRQADRHMTERADLIFACSEPLAASHRNASCETILLPHAVDLDHFSQTESEPADLAAIPHPRACFFGLIYEKIDFQALAELAAKQPQLHIVMIGPVKTDVGSLTATPNVHFLGAKAYEALPAYLQAMDVLVIPYVLDGESMNKAPLKVRECLALGKPTVARSIPDLEGFGDVLSLYENREAFAEAVATALGRDSPSLRARMRERVQGETWEARVASVMEHLDRLQHRPPP